MSNNIKEIVIKNRTYYLFDDIIHIENLNLNKIEIDEKSHQDIFIYYIGYVVLKNLSYVKILV